MKYTTLKLSLLFAVLCVTIQANAFADSITQHRINELAARCVTAQMAMSGLHGKQKPGETAEQFKTRIKGYLDALDTVDKALAPIHQVPSLVNRGADNTQLWQRVSAAATRLSGEVSDVKAAWKAHPTEGDKAKLGPKLAQALATV